MFEALQLLVKILLFFEGLRLRAYQDAVGVWTIGVGETKGVRPGMVWTKDYAMSRLYIRALEFMNEVFKACPQLVNEPPKRIAACSSLAYNIGVRAFSASTVRSATARREYQRAADAFLVWNKAKGRVLPGLTFRRKKERLYYLLQI